MGLPYAADPSITAHTLKFLRQADGFAEPTHVLFNGGAMLPGCMRRRMLDTIAGWCGGRKPTELVSADLSLAVAEGAAGYAAARAGHGPRVKGGIARAYYIMADTEEGGRLLCIMPRDTEEGVAMRLDAGIRIRVNQAVQFPLYASATRLGDRLGDIVAQDENVTPLAPVNTVIKYGRRGGEAPVAIVAVLGGTGVLEMSCEVEGRSYPLAFDLRGNSHGGARAMDAVERESLDAAMAAVERAFASRNFGGLTTELERHLGSGRTEWSAYVLRKIGDMLLEKADWRRQGAEAEARWLNLCGFCLRPGFGFAGDEWRAGECWKLWFGGPLFPHSCDNVVQWNIFWRRIAGGLRAGQQGQAFAAMSRGLVGANGCNAVRPNDQAGVEQWRAAASMERVVPGRKLKLAQALLNGRMNDSMFWAWGRLAARVPFHGGQDDVIPGSAVEEMLEPFMRRAAQAGVPRTALFAMASACRKTGNRLLDIGDGAREKALKWLGDSGAPDEWKKLAAEGSYDDSAIGEEVFGEQLPLGLSIGP